MVVDKNLSQQVRIFSEFQGRIFRPPQDSARPIKGRVVMVHGLNLAPASMDPLAERIAAEGYVVARVALSGHRDRFIDFVRVRHEAWQDDVAAAVAAFNTMEVEVREAPLFGVGFSLGGLLLSHHARKARQTDGGAIWSALALLAPAFTPRLTVGFPLGFLPGWLPYFSFTPRRFRRWAFCPHNAYRAVGALMREHMAMVHKAGGGGGAQVLSSAPKPRVLVLVHQRDELVHADKLRNSFFGNGFDGYEVRYLRRVHRSWMVPRHLICHPEALKDDAWEALCQQILKIF